MAVNESLGCKMVDKKHVFDGGLLSLGILGVALMRIWMAPLPNVEPIMLFTITAGIAAGPVAGFLMGAGAMVLSTFMMLPHPQTLAWLLQMPLITLYTSLTYGVIGILCGLLGMVRKGWGRAGYMALAVCMTLLYDLVTCVCFAIQFYGPAGIPMALDAQVPFTIMHMSNALFALLLAPSLSGAISRVRGLWTAKDVRGTGLIALRESMR